MRALRADTLSPWRAEIGSAISERNPSVSANFLIVGFDLAKHVFAVVDEVDLVDREHDMADAEQRNDDRMAMRLREQPLARIDQHDREIGVGRAGRHVAGELLMAGRVGDNERALFGREIAISDVDRDALLAFGLEAVDQKRIVDRLAGRAELLRVALKRRKLVVEDQLLLVQHPPDECGLAVVDRAAGEDDAEAVGQKPHGSNRRRSSEVALALLLFHRGGFVRIDKTSLPLGGGGLAHLGHDIA